MPSAVFETAIPANKRLQLYALDQAATGIGQLHLYRVTQKKTGNFEKPNKNLINPRKKVFIDRN